MVCSPLSVRYGTLEMTAIIIILKLHKKQTVVVIDQGTTCPHVNKPLIRDCYYSVIFGSSFNRKGFTVFCQGDCRCVYDNLHLAASGTDRI